MGVSLRDAPPHPWQSRDGVRCERRDPGPGPGRVPRPGWSRCPAAGIRRATAPPEPRGSRPRGHGARPRRAHRGRPRGGQGGVPLGARREGTAWRRALRGVARGGPARRRRRTGEGASRGRGRSSRAGRACALRARGGAGPLGQREGERVARRATPRRDGARCRHRRSPERALLADRAAGGQHRLLLRARLAARLLPRRRRVGGWQPPRRDHRHAGQVAVRDQVAIRRDGPLHVPDRRARGRGDGLRPGDPFGHPVPANAPQRGVLARR